jgi:hypothetical protein
MTRPGAERLIESLSANVQPVQPLTPPAKRATTTLVALGVAGAVAVLAAANLRQFQALHAGREWLLAAEMAAMLATAVLAITGAFFTAVPGRSRRWLVAPLPFLGMWLLLSGIGCFEWIADGSGQGRAGEGAHDSNMHCLLFILGASALIGPPLIWRLARANPFDPLPVALLGGLGMAALSAFLLQFFHPFAVTLLDLGVHFAAIALVIGIMGLLNRRALSLASNGPATGRGAR